LLQAQIQARPTPAPYADLKARMKDCMHDTNIRDTTSYDGSKLSCFRNSSYFTATPTAIDAYGYQITDPVLAKRMFDELTKDYVDYFIQHLLEGIL
jgi:hypothetical protein